MNDSLATKTSQENHQKNMPPLPFPTSDIIRLSELQCLRVVAGELVQLAILHQSYFQSFWEARSIAARIALRANPTESAAAALALLLLQDPRHSAGRQAASDVRADLTLGAVAMFQNRAVPILSELLQRALDLCASLIPGERLAAQRFIDEHGEHFQGDFPPRIRLLALCATARCARALQRELARTADHSLVAQFPRQIVTMLAELGIDLNAEFSQYAALAEAPKIDPATLEISPEMLDVLSDAQIAQLAGPKVFASRENGIAAILAPKTDAAAKLAALTDEQVQMVALEYGIASFYPEGFGAETTPLPIDREGLISAILEQEAAREAAQGAT